jgi:cardiolipin-specific phospholipase
MPYLKRATDSFTQLPSEAAAEAAADPYGNRVWKRTLVQLSGQDRALNEISVERVGEETEETLVMLHGYGAGLGFFYKNLEPISRTKGLQLYALDMLGMGNSSRPNFKLHAKEKEDKVIEAESFFIDALEEWRKARKIERFTLLGHSLGGYLAVSYALKYPGHLNKLILASPVGIPEDPFAVNSALPEPEESTMTNEFTQSQDVTTESNTTARSARAANTARRPMPGWLVWLWDQNVSPFSIVRLAGPLGPRFVSGWTSRRFSHLPPAEAQALHDYSFSIFKQKGSGEYALTYLLAPGAYARRPVIHRIQGVGRQVISRDDDGKPLKKEHGFPVVFMYGENDWMDADGGHASAKKLNQASKEALSQASDEEKRLEKGSARVVIVPKAGHHLYLDNPDSFNKYMAKEMKQTLTDLRQQRAENQNSN